MKERPILMSGANVPPLLDGRKKQTRRVMEQQPKGRFLGFVERPIRSANDPPVLRAWFQDAMGSVEITCPYGKPSDRMWVREAWRTTNELDAFSGSEIAQACLDAGYDDPWTPLQYEADKTRINWAHTGMPPPMEAEPPPGRYRHARFMPRWASRITLEITDVRVERLQDISESDAWAEGIAGHPDGPIHAYRSLWTLINGAGSWDANPWVWAISFHKVSP